MAKDSPLFNPRKSRRILKIICCMDYVQEPLRLKYLNFFYIGLVYALQTVVICQGLVEAYRTPDVAEKVEAIHYVLVIVIISAYITNELLNFSKVNEAMEVMELAYTDYNGSPITPEQRQVHLENGRMCMLMNRVFSCLMSGSSVAYLVFAPIKNALFQEQSAARSLPIPMYTPYDATKNPAYVLSVLWEGVTLFYLCAVATSAHQSFIGYMGVLRSELKLLNFSIDRREERALKLSGQSEVSWEDYKDPQFQEALYFCLREDIIHHQLLLRFYTLTKSYLGFILLMYIIVASIILAAAGYLITRPNGAMDETIKFVIIVCSELYFIFQLCLYGEMVSEESGKTFRKIFRGNWNDCTMKYRTTLHTMLIGTIKPMQLRTNVFNIAASLETYNSVLTTSFQYFNVLRKFQSQ